MRANGRTSITDYPRGHFIAQHQCGKYITVARLPYHQTAHANTMEEMPFRGKREFLSVSRRLHWHVN